MRTQSHPNIVKVYEVFDLDNYIGLAMELLDGGNLSSRLLAGPLPESYAFSVLKPILECLSYLHSKDIVHRDLKPTNVMFKQVIKGEPAMDIVKVIDFGLCADLNDKSDESLLHDKSGTVGYLAPELIAMTKKSGFYDSKIDVFSAGVVFYETLAGKCPFKAKNYKDSMHLNYKCDLDIRSLNQNLETKEFLAKLVSKNPKYRLTADNALENDIFMKIEQDEFNSRITPMSSKFTLANDIKPRLKSYAENNDIISPMSSALYKDANFRMDLSRKSGQNSQLSFIKLADTNCADESNNLNYPGLAGTNSTQAVSFNYKKTYKKKPSYKKVNNVNIHFKNNINKSNTLSEDYIQSVNQAPSKLTPGQNYKKTGEIELTKDNDNGKMNIFATLDKAYIKKTQNPKKTSHNEDDCDISSDENNPLDKFMNSYK